MLVLFDIDGTLLEAPSEIHARALEEACAQIHGVTLHVPPIGADAYNGLTSPGLGRLLLRDAGLTDEAIDDAAGAWREAMTAAYVRLQATIPEQRPFADARAVLEALTASGVRIGLLTGNFRAIAEAKMRVAGAWHDQIELGQGAFGDDAEERDDLGRIARRRWDGAGGRGDLVIVGDTPRDVSCARAAGAQALAVTTGGFGAADLAEADVVAASLTEVVEALMG
jgi:phosphoglycolate phosphatase-like HAD superfamily hydrolase